MAHVVVQCCWLQQHRPKLHVSVPLATVVYCNNVSGIYMRSTSTSSARRLLLDKFVLSMSLCPTNSVTLFSDFWTSLRIIYIYIYIYIYIERERERALLLCVATLTYDNYYINLQVLLSGLHNVMVNVPIYCSNPTIVNMH